MQAEVEQREVEATAGGGAVKVVVTGAKQIKSIEIAPEVVDPDDSEMLADLVMAAVNEALRKATEDKEQKMNAITGNLNMPGLF